jgi:hypothetical protein
MILRLSVTLALWEIATNATLRLGGQWTTVAMLSLAALAFFLAFSFKRPLPKFQMARPELAALSCIVAACWLSTAAYQMANPDDDYWIHSPVQSQIFRAVLPPHNPFLTDYQLGGSLRSRSAHRRIQPPLWNFPSARSVVGDKPAPTELHPVVGINSENLRRVRF